MMARSNGADPTTTSRAGRGSERASRRCWLGAGLLLAAVVFAYAPALRGGFIWDDEAHVTRPDLRSWHGLYRIWFEPGATQQYYPLLHSAFWVQHRLWGDATLGYHLVNLSLHCGAVLLVGLILRRLAVPGAFLAAAIFALHPVHVESVAWITEQKNTLSAVFYLGAALAYLHFDERRGKLPHVAALGLFILGLLSKTVTATLPAALLVVFWWRRGRLSWRGDVLPLVPFFLLGAVGGLFTAWAERKLVGAEGAEFEFTLIERGLIAGRVIWFYLGKLVWPANLTFIYPRWEISQTVWWQYLFPLGAIGLLAALWLYRKRSRAPLAAALFFGGTLFPVLGFFNVYPFRYSLVADHFQYLASLGIITLFAAGVAGLATARRVNSDRALVAVGAILVSVLGTLTWRQSHQYADIETLYRETIARNPACWLAHNNWGNALNSLGRPQEAIVHLKHALRINPEYPEAHNNLGNAMNALGRPKEAVGHYEEALRIRPLFAQAHNNLGSALQALGRPQDAIPHYEEALDIKRDYAEAHNNWADALNSLGRHGEAIRHCEEALRIQPDYAEAHNNWANALNALGRHAEAIENCQQAVLLEPEFVEARINWGNALLALGRPQEAVPHYEDALRINQDVAETHNNLGNALIALGRSQEALLHYQEALRLNPDYFAAHINLGKALQALGRFREAVQHYEHALRLGPNRPEPHDRLAWLWATCPEAQFRNGRRALSHARNAARLTGENDATILETLAAASAEAGDFQEAVRWQGQALGLAPGQHKTESLERLKLYLSGRPFRETLKKPVIRTPSKRPDPFDCSWKDSPPEFPRTNGRGFSSKRKHADASRTSPPCDAANQAAFPGRRHLAQSDVAHSPETSHGNALPDTRYEEVVPFRHVSKTRTRNQH